jgi:hypothetical protein
MYIYEVSLIRRGNLFRYYLRQFKVEFEGKTNQRWERGKKRARIKEGIWDGNKNQNGNGSSNS